MSTAGLLIVAAGLILILMAGVPTISYHLRNYETTRVRIAQSANYKWWVFGTVGTGTFMSVVGHGSILIALPTIARHFDAGFTTVLWIVISETLAVSSLLLPMGRVSDIVGRKQVYLSGYIFFLIASATAGLSTNLVMLMVARVIQGAGSAMIQANGQAMVLSVFPENERGKALGTQFSVLGVGSMSGMVVGGLLISTLGWRSIFLINLPIGIIAVTVAMIVLDKSRFTQETQRAGRPAFDWLGAFLSAGTLLTVLLAMTFGNRSGWGSPPVVSAFLLSVILLPTFIWWELHTASPMLDLRLFQRKLVAMGIAAGWLSFLGSSGVRFLMAIYLQSVLGYGPREAGLITLPMAIAMTFVGPVAGRLSDRFGWQKFNVGGSALAALALFLIATTVNETSSVMLIIPLLILQSVGTGLFGSPNNSSIMSAVERPRYGIMSAMTSLTRNSANITSNAVATAIVVTTMASLGAAPSLGAVSAEPQAFIAGLHRAFMAAGFMVVIAMVISILKGDRPKEAPQQVVQPRTGEPTTSA